MKSWQQAIRDSVIPGAFAGVATSAVAAARGRRETGSAAASINATSHVLWGDKAARVERLTLRHTLPGVLINTGAALFWAVAFEKLFGRAIDRGRAPMALIGGAATAGLAYVTDYKLVPRRLTPGYEKRVSGRSLFAVYGALALTLAAGAMLARRGAPVGRKSELRRAARANIRNAQRTSALAPTH